MLGCFENLIGAGCSDTKHWQERMRKMPMIIWKCPATVTTRITYLSLGRCSVCSTHYIAPVSQLDLLSQLKIQSHCTQALRWSTSSHLILLLNILQSIIIINQKNSGICRFDDDVDDMYTCRWARVRISRMPNQKHELGNKKDQIWNQKFVGGLAAANFWK